MAKKYETLKAVFEAVKSGELDETKLKVTMDNDCSVIVEGEYGEDGEGVIYRGKGYMDIEDLWPLVFPKATVDWC